MYLTLRSIVSSVNGQSFTPRWKSASQSLTLLNIPTVFLKFWTEEGNKPASCQNGSVIKAVAVVQRVWNSNHEGAQVYWRVWYAWLLCIGSCFNIYLATCRLLDVVATCDSTVAYCHCTKRSSARRYYTSYSIDDVFNLFLSVLCTM